MTCDAAAVGDGEPVAPCGASFYKWCADRHTIERGRVVWSGSSAEFASATDVQHRYLGV
jgi:ABC-type branched-subunit amino acid transport system ATPase component